MIAALSLLLLVAGAVRALAPRDRALQGAAALLGFGVWAAALGAGILAGWPRAVDLLCAAAGAALCFFPWSAPAEKTEPAPWGLRALAAVTGLAAGAVFLSTLRVFPDGGWDAMMIWNLRARVFAIDPQPLQHAFDPVLYHTNYPLLVSGAVARLWMLFDAGAVPALVAALFAGGCAFSLFVFAGRLGSAGAACVAIALFFGAPIMARVAAWQYADVPLALWMLLAVAFAAYGAQKGQPRAFAAAGLAAGLGAWTKNEGLLLFLCAGAATGFCAPRELRRRALLNFTAGALPLLALVAAFKLSPYPRANYLFEHFSVTGALHKLADLTRWSAVAEAFALQPGSPRRWGFGFWASGPVLLLRLAKGPRSLTPAEKLAWTAVALALAGDFAVYLLTPLTLHWQLETSLDRLFVHIYPAVLLAFSAGIARLNPP